VYEKSFDPKWDWLKFNMSAAANWRYYDTQNHSGTKYSDLVNRGDLSRPFSQLNRFAVSLLEPALPVELGSHQHLHQRGFGALFDITVKEKTISSWHAADWVSIYSHVPLESYQRTSASTPLARLTALAVSIETCAAFCRSRRCEAVPADSS